MVWVRPITASSAARHMKPITKKPMTVPSKPRTKSPTPGMGKASSAGSKSSASRGIAAQFSSASASAGTKASGNSVAKLAKSRRNVWPVRAKTPSGGRGAASVVFQGVLLTGGILAMGGAPGESPWGLADPPGREKALACRGARIRLTRRCI